MISDKIEVPVKDISRVASTERLLERFNSPDKASKDAFTRIIKTFPEFPPFPMRVSEFSNLSMRVSLFKDKRALYQLQQQSWLGEWLLGRYE